MAKSKPARRAKPRPKKKVRPPAEPPRDEGANALSPALLEEGRRAARDGSVEDPLQDWPEAEGEPDRWLDERGGQGVQQPDD
jgi:hypothetical protein